MDVVYVVGEHTDELRYSLRTLQHVVHDRVWIVGHLPNWVRNVGHVLADDPYKKARNIAEKMRAAVNHPEISDQFIYYNDDFFSLQPAPIPVRHRGLADTARPAGLMGSDLGLNDSRKWTFWHLRNTWGVDPVISYDLVHVPMVVDKGLMAGFLDDARKVKLFSPQVRSLYGNRAGIGGSKGGNAKVGKAGDPIKESVWVSTNVNSWSGKAGDVIRARFPNPSPYEEV